MPYPIQKRDGKFCVILETTGEVMGCHDTEAAARQQQSALYASESKASGIEVDALSTPTQERSLSITPESHGHQHEALASFLAYPEMKRGWRERLSAMFQSQLYPQMTVVKGTDGRRYMFLITSNSYRDREDEIITSKALEQYERSCYPGAGLYHNDNPFLWWHDDNVVMGSIEAVYWAPPFLIEIAKEAPTRTARVLWDYAETCEDAAVSHRFGYREKDRNEKGEYSRIVKLETSFLPERKLAANPGTYAGVVDMNEDSEKRLNEIYRKATGGLMEDAAKQLRENAKKFELELARMGIQHKAKQEKQPAGDEEEMPPAGDEIGMEQEGKQELPNDFMQKLQQLEMIWAMCLELAKGEEQVMEQVMSLDKAIKALETWHTTREKATSDSTAALEKRIELLEARLKMSQRRASQSAETSPEHVMESIQQAMKQAGEADLVESPLWGRIKPSPYGNGRGG